MFSCIHGRLYACSRRALLSSCAAITGGLFLAISPLHAEGLDRVYQVQASVTPTELVSKVTPEPTQLTFKVTPNDRKKMVHVNVDQGDNAYKINSYRLRVRLRPNSDGSSDNGTLTYSFASSIEHTVGPHTSSLLSHARGNIALHQGVGQIVLPNNKFFSGSISIKAIASSF